MLPRLITAALTGSVMCASLIGIPDRPAFAQISDKRNEPALADPSILSVGSAYFAYGTNSGDENVPTLESNDLSHWSQIGDALPSLPSWASPGLVWSPDATLDPQGGYELFFSAYDKGMGTFCVGRAVSSSPVGPFVATGAGPVLCQGNEGGAIDPSIYSEGGSDYLLWKSDGEGGQATGIWVQRLDSTDSTLLGSPTELLTANSEWEDGIVEGPAMVRVSGGLYLLFSGNHWRTSNYAIGATTCSTPVGPCSPDAQILLRTSGTSVGPGGPSTFSVFGKPMLAYSTWIGSSSVAEKYPARVLKLGALVLRSGDLSVSPTAVSA